VGERSRRREANANRLDVSTIFEIDSAALQNPDDKV
jgi:hypothetical protein